MTKRKFGRSSGITEATAGSNALACGLLCLVLAGCATKVEVEGRMPAALSQALPLRAGLVLDPGLQNYTYQSDKGRDVSLAIGKAQTRMFRTIAASLFSRATVLEAMPAGNADLDLLLSPRVEEIQLATPKETKLKVYEVWIKYNLRIFASDGEPVADWIMTAYGKTPSRFMKSDEDALNQAAVVALRDAGARLVLELPRIPEVRSWLADRQRPTLAKATGEQPPAAAMTKSAESQP